MKINTKVFVLLFILFILSISYTNASDLENNIQDNDIINLGISEETTYESNEDMSLDNSLDNNIKSNFEDESSSTNYFEDKASSESNLGDNYSFEPNLNDEDSSDSVLESNKNNKNSLSDDSSTVHQVGPNTYSNFFDRNGYVLTNLVSSGDTIDLSGNFNRKNFIFTIACSITSSQNDAYLTNCMVEFENVTSNSPSSVSNLNFNTSIEKAPCVYIVGSTYVDVYNCKAYSTGANSNPTLLVGSSYCNIHNNNFETTFTGYMNMSWKRAGILLGESHYNNIYSNFVSVKDSNPIYLTTYGFEKSNYNVIFNNTVTTSAFSDETGLRNPSAWAYGVHIMGDYNQILNNTIMNTYRGVDSEGSFNVIVGNKIFNLSGSYYEGNNGTDGGEGGIFASYDNIIINNTIYDSKITGPAIYAVVNTTVIGNTVRNITGPYGIQFALSASNCLIDNNTFDMNSGEAIYVKGNMANLTLSNNIISTKNGTGILILKQTRAKFPVDVTIANNIFLEHSKVYINYSDVEGKTIINLANNTVVVVNQTFFKFFSTDGEFTSNDLFENFIFKGEFSNLASLSTAEVVKSIDLNGKTTITGDNAVIRDISFNINANNVKIDNVLVNISNAIANAFSFNNAKNSSLINSIIYFNQSVPSASRFVPIFSGNSNITLSNNTIIVYSENTALALNNSYCNLLDNIFNSSGLNHPVILNDNGSYLLFGENKINALADPAVVSINGAIIIYTYFIIDDSNYYEYFNPDGSFLDDVIFNFGDTIRIGNINNKLFRFDIPLIVLAEKGTILNNSFIILEGESSNSLVANFTFRLEDHDSSGEISFITLKDGVGNVIIENNKFYANNVSGDSASLNAIKITPSEFISENVLIRNNIIVIDSNLSQINGIFIRNQDLGLSNTIVESLSILNNSISIANGRINGTGNSINLLSAIDSQIFNNSIIIKSYHANGILLGKSNATIRNNSIEVIGLDYGKILDYIADNALKDLIEDSQIKADCAISKDDNTYVNEDIADDNILIENNAETELIHSSNFLKDLENIIRNTKNPNVDLGNNIYIIRDPITVDKTLNISNGIIISDLKMDNVLFNIVSCNDSFRISNSTVVLDNANVFALLNSLNDDSFGLINVSPIDISGNEFMAIGDDVVAESVTILELISHREILNPNNNISINNNLIGAGMKPFKFDVLTIVNGSDIIISNNNTLLDRTPTRIIYKDMNVTAVDLATDGRVGEYFKFELTDDTGNPIANAPMEIGFNGVIYDYNDGIVTDENGEAQLQINLGYKGVYTFAICFLGNDKYDASFVVAKITVNLQNPVISTSNYYYKASAKSKKISVSLKSASRKPLPNKTIKLVLNGKTYSAKTNSKGLATINVSVSTKKTYSFTVKYDGNSMYAPVSKTAKLVIS